MASASPHDGSKDRPQGWTRRTLLGAMAAGAAGFAAFGPRGARTRAEGRIVLDYWEKWTGHEGAAMQAVVDEFNESQSRILVRYLVTAGIDQKSMIAIAGGDPPDVLGLYNYNIPLFAETGALLPLDEGDGSAAIPPLEAYAEAIRPLLTHPDRTGRSRRWACPNTGGALALYYNKAMFAQAGLDPTRPPATLEQLVDVSARLDASRDGLYTRLGFTPTEPGWWPWAWGAYFGASLTDPSARRARVDSPEHAAAFGWIRQTAARLGPERINAFGSGWGNSYDSINNAFLAGQVAMVLQGPWLASVINAHNPDLDYGVAPFPVPASIAQGPPIGLVESDMLCIPRGVRHPEASMEFIAFTQQPRIVERLSTAHFKNSVLAGVSPEFVAKHPNRGVAVFNAVANSPRGFHAARTRQFPQIRSKMGSLFPKVWNTDTPVEELLKGVNAEVQSLLDLEHEQKARRGWGSGA